jgi:hypothetical protein
MPTRIIFASVLGLSVCCSTLVLAQTSRSDAGNGMSGGIGGGRTNSMGTMNHNGNMGTSSTLNGGKTSNGSTGDGTSNSGALKGPPGMANGTPAPGASSTGNAESNSRSPSSVSGGGAGK